MAKKIVMSCIHYWHSPYQVATHHIARQFAAAGWQVAYISSPITPLHLLKYSDDGVRERFSFLRNDPEVENIGSGSVTSIVPFSLLAPDNQFPLNSQFVVKNWTKFGLPKISDQLDNIGFSDVDIFYLDNFYHASVQYSLKFRYFVYHMADNYSGFPGYSQAFRKVEEKLVSTVDRVVYPSLDMEEYVESLDPKEKHFIPNGVDFKHFKDKGSNAPKEYENIPRPIAVYVGAIEEWFDFDLVNRVAKTHENVSLVLIGGSKLAKERLEALPNIYLLGIKSRDDLPPYLEHADVGIIPFNVKKFPALINPVRPLKLLEYCAAGLPTISVSWREIEGMNSPAHLSKGDNEFVNLFDDLSILNNDEVLLKKYSAQFHWEIIFEEMLSVIQQ